MFKEVVNAEILQFSDKKTDEDDTVHPVRVLMYIQGNVLVT